MHSRLTKLIMLAFCVVVFYSFVVVFIRSFAAKIIIPARQQAVSSPLEKGTAENAIAKTTPNQSNQQFYVVFYSFCCRFYPFFWRPKEPNVEHPPPDSRLSRPPWERGQLKSKN